MAEHMVYLDDSSFENAVASGVTLVDFYADWCGPCRTIAPVIERLSTTFAGKAKVAKLDIDKAQEVTGKYGVTSIPTIILFKDGQEIKRIVGLRSEEELKGLITAAL